jgi:hypothetical protein
MWRARIYCLGKHVTLGRFNTSSEAAFVHDRAAFYIHGDTAQTNYGLDAARESNEREPPSSSWRVMSTLETLARENKIRLLAVRHGLLARNHSSRRIGGQHSTAFGSDWATAATTASTATAAAAAAAEAASAAHVAAAAALSSAQRRRNLVQGLHFPPPFALLARAVDEDVALSSSPPLDPRPMPRDRVQCGGGITKHHYASRSASTKGVVYALVAAANRALVVVA